MNWTVDNGLYHRFLKWRLKCETILDCELANLPAKQKCQKIIAWSGNFGMDLYVSWSIPKEELTLDAIWAKFEEFLKPQMNEVRACFDLLTSFHQGNRNIDEWYNVVQAQVNLAKYLLETAKILHRDIFLFFMKDEDFVTKTINNGNVNIQKFPASKADSWPRKWRVQKPLLNILDRWQEIYQLCKFNLCDISALNFLLETIPRGRRLQQQGRNCKTTGPWKFTHPRNPLISRSWKHTPIDVTDVVTHYMPKDFNVLEENFNAKYVTNLGISP